MLLKSLIEEQATLVSNTFLETSMVFETEVEMEQGLESIEAAVAQLHRGEQALAGLESHQDTLAGNPALYQHVVSSAVAGIPGISAGEITQVVDAGVGVEGLINKIGKGIAALWKFIIDAIRAVINFIRRRFKKDPIDEKERKKKAEAKVDDLKEQFAEAFQRDQPYKVTPEDLDITAPKKAERDITPEKTINKVTSGKNGDAESKARWAEIERLQKDIDKMQGEMRSQREMSKEDVKKKIDELDVEGALTAKYVTNLEEVEEIFTKQPQFVDLYNHAIKALLDHIEKNGDSFTESLKAMKADAFKLKSTIPKSAERLLEEIQEIEDSYGKLEKGKRKTLLSLNTALVNCELSRRNLIPILTFGSSIANSDLVATELDNFLAETSLNDFTLALHMSLPDATRLYPDASHFFEIDHRPMTKEMETEQGKTLEKVSRVMQKDLGSKLDELNKLIGKAESASTRLVEGDLNDSYLAKLKNKVLETIEDKDISEEDLCIKIMEFLNTNTDPAFDLNKLNQYKLVNTFKSIQGASTSLIKTMGKFTSQYQKVVKEINGD